MSLDITPLFVVNVISLVLMFMFMGAKFGAETHEFRSLYNMLYWIFLIITWVCILLR